MRRPLLHRIAKLLHVDAVSREKMRVWWLRTIHWKPRYYREAVCRGVSTTRNSPRIIVSLTSYPARIGLVHETINTLLNQALKPDKIILWLAESQFPCKEADLPKELLKQREFGLELEWCEDLRSYKKLIPALRKYPEDIIVTVDDDIFYHPDMLQELVESYKKDPLCVHAQSAMIMEFDGDGNPTRYRNWHYARDKGATSFSLLILGGTGALYPPHCLDKMVFDKSLYSTLAPNADDIWFWAMAVKAGTKICVAHEGSLGCSNNYNANNDAALWNVNMDDRSGNDSQLRNVIAKFSLGASILGR